MHTYLNEVSGRLPESDLEMLVAPAVSRDQATLPFGICTIASCPTAVVCSA